MKVTLCGRKACCPTVERISGGVIIEDKGVSIEFTTEQWAMLIEKINLGVI